MDSSPKKKPLSPAQLQSVAALFRALCDPLRLAILQTLCEQPRCVGEIVEHVGTSQANVSKHLRKLVSGAVLLPETRGRHVFYRLAHGLPLRLCELVHAEIARLPRRRTAKLKNAAARKRPPRMSAATSASGEISAT
jgi:DNA-binding transcriptional ArsR family regulator